MNITDCENSSIIELSKNVVIKKGKAYTRSRLFAFLLSQIILDACNGRESEKRYSKPEISSIVSVSYKIKGNQRRCSGYVRSNGTLREDCRKKS